jgi:tRNA (guanine37-N1)-methyltransferase
MVGKFKEGEAVADVMAGVGPFAVPAGKKKVFVMANDLNPESFAGLKENIALNKVHPFVKPFNEDGGKFIWKAAVAQLKLQRSVDVVSRTDKRSVHSALRRGDISAEKSVALLRTPKKLVQPRFFHHFVMNLPASAITFLPSFIGVYAQPEFMSLTEAERDAIPMPMVHVYTFGPKSDDNVAPTKEILEEVSRQLGNEITLETEEAEVWDVRDVAPKKRMFCASFRLPREVAFRKVVV